MSSKLFYYVLKQILLAVLTIWIVITFTFFVMHAVPGGPFVGEKAISKEAQAKIVSVQVDSEKTPAAEPQKEDV